MSVAPYRQRIQHAVTLAVQAMENNDTALFPIAIERLRGLLTGVLSPVHFDFMDKPSFIDFLLKKLEIKSRSSLAKEIGVCRQAVSAWQVSERIPLTGMKKLRARFGAERIDLLVKEYEEASS